MDNDYSRVAKEIKKITPDQWVRLLEYIPVLQDDCYGKWSELKQGKTGVYTLPYVEYSSDVMSFIKLCYETGVIIPFDWANWLKENSISENEEAFIENADLGQCAMLLTAHIRADRFMEGHLFSALENGIILRILKRIKLLLD